MEIVFDKYFQFQNHYHSPYAEEHNAQYVDLTAIDGFTDYAKRRYITRYLKLTWELSDDFKDKKAELTTAFHILLYEFMPVLFPYRYQYIQILSDNSIQKEVREKIPWIFPEHNVSIPADDRIELYIIEDSFSDLGILKAIQNHLEYIFKHLYDLLMWLDENAECHLSDYLEYVKGDDFYAEKLRFLRYGLKPDEMPWNISMLRQFIKENAFFNTDTLDENHRRRCLEVSKNIKVACDYCGEYFSLNEVEVMEDGLHRCKSCAEDAVDTLEQAEELEQLARELYREVLNIDFDKENITYKFHFVTATELHRAFNKPFYVTNRYDERKAVGLATDRKIDEIWIEKFRKREKTMATIIHELMHIIQYQKFNYFKIKQKEPLLVEGMAIWAENYLLRHSQDPAFQAYAEQNDAYWQQDPGEYGKAYRYLLDRYGNEPFRKLMRRYGM